MPKHKPMEGTTVGVSPLYFLAQAIWKIFRFFLMLCMTFVILYPLLYMCSMAFRVPEDVFDPSIVWLPRTLTLDNFKTIFELNHYGELFGNTVLLSFGSTLFQLFTCSLVGYGFARFKFRGKGIFMGLLFFTIIVPPQMVSLPTFVNFKDFDIMGIFNMIFGHGMGFSLLNNPISFYLMALLGQGIRSGMFILLFMQFYKGMPKDLENAALVDGCGDIKTYFRIMLPNARNIILMVVLLSVVWYWNDYYMASIYMGTFPTVSTQLAGFRASLELYMTSMGDSAFDAYSIVTMEQAACLLTIAPLLAIYLCVQKQFITSIEKTGLVG